MYNIQQKATMSSICYQHTMNISTRPLVITDLLLSVGHFRLANKSHPWDIFLWSVKTCHICTTINPEPTQYQQTQYHFKYQSQRERERESLIGRPTLGLSVCTRWVTPNHLSQRMLQDERLNFLSQVFMPKYSFQQTQDIHWVSPWRPNCVWINM